MINLKRTAGLWDDMYPHRSARSCHGANSSKSTFSVGFQSCFRWCEAWVGKDVYPRRVGMIRGRADRNSGSHGRDLQIHISTRMAFLGTRPIQSRPLILPVSRFISAKVITSDKVRLEPLSRSVEKGPDSDIMMSLLRLFLGLLEMPNLSPTIHPAQYPQCLLPRPQIRKGDARQRKG
jgi:hypothetical protein